MPLKFRWDEVERLMDVRGIENRDALAAIAGIHRSNLYKLSRAEGYNKPSFAALEKLCVALECQPGDLLRLEPDEDEAGP